MKTIQLSIACLFFYCLELQPETSLSWWLVLLLWVLLFVVGATIDCFNAVVSMERVKEALNSKKQRIYKK